MCFATPQQRVQLGPAPRPDFHARSASTPSGLGCARLATLAFAPPHPGGWEEGKKDKLQKDFLHPPRGRFCILTYLRKCVIALCHRAVENRPEESDSKPATLREGVHISFGSSIKRFRLRVRQRAGAELRASSSRPRRLKVSLLDLRLFLFFLGEHRGFLDTITLPVMAMTWA